MGDISLRGQGIVRRKFASGSTPAWQRKEGKSESGGLNKKGGRVKKAKGGLMRGMPRIAKRGWK